MVGEVLGFASRLIALLFKPLVDNCARRAALVHTIDRCIENLVDGKANRTIEEYLAEVSDLLAAMSEHHSLTKKDYPWTGLARLLKERTSELEILTRTVASAGWDINAIKSFDEIRNAVRTLLLKGQPYNYES